MKSIKSIITALTALIMIFALAVPVMADENTGETVEGVTGQNISKTAATMKPS